jgi:hypothetical protein
VTDFLHDLFTPAAGLTGSLGMLVGIWLGYRMNVTLDRRKTFNAISQQLRSELLKFRDRPGIVWITEVDADLYYRLAGPIHRRRFRSAVERYRRAQKAATRRDSIGGVNYDKPGKVEELRASYDMLLRLTEWS